MYTDSTSAEPYEIIAYNEPNDVVISGNDAVISMDEDGLLAALPGYLFAVILIPLFNCLLTIHKRIAYEAK